jgi:hypothetical protein
VVHSSVVHIFPDLDRTKTTVNAKADIDDDVEYKGSCEESSSEAQRADQEDIDDDSSEEECDQEPADTKAKCIWSVCKIWDHYKGRLENVLPVLLISVQYILKYVKTPGTPTTVMQRTVKL